MTLNIRVVPAKDLSAIARDAIDALCVRAYNEDLRGLFATFTDPVHVIGSIDGDVVSHALWVTRWLKPNHGPVLRTAYVEAVATDPSCRGRGFASEVMTALTAEVSDFELAALCPADKAQALYSRLGWEHWRGPLSIRQGAKRIATPDEKVMIHRLGRPLTLDLDGSLSAEWRTGDLW